MNPVSQLAMVRSAIQLTGAVSRVAGAAAGELIGGAGASFKEILSDSPSSAAPAPVGEDSVTAQLERMQAELLDAVRSVLTQAGIDLSQSQPLELVIGAGGRTTIPERHPQQFTLETVLNGDEAVREAASRLIAFRSDHLLQAQPLRLTVQE